jgi:hypothetical protein
MLPNGDVMWRRSVSTKDTEEFRNTRKEIEKRDTPRRYVTAWMGRTCDEKGRRRSREDAILVFS